MAQYLPQKTSKLLKAGALKTPPAYYQALLSHPPPASITRAPASRSETDLPERWSSTHQARTQHEAKVRRKHKLKPLPIEWRQEDYIRQQFLKEHPWEKVRAGSITELGAVGQGWKGEKQGKEWTKLKERSRNPSIDDVVDYTMHLHSLHQVPLNEAYSSAVAQFRSLRATHQYALRTAQLEAQSYGAEFTSVGFIGAGSIAEERHLKRWDEEGQVVTEGKGAQKPAILTNRLFPQDAFTSGLGYLSKAKGAPTEAKMDEQAETMAQKPRQQKKDGHEWLDELAKLESTLPVDAQVG